MEIDCKGIEYKRIELGKASDITNQRFERLVAKYRVQPTKNTTTHTFWLCECDCGNKVVADRVNLARKHTKSCGCLCKEIVQSQSSHYMGEIVNGFTFIEKDLTRQSANGAYYWKVKCPYCGKEYSADPNMIKNSSIQSCGCLSISKGEKMIQTVLDTNHLDYKTQFVFKNLFSSRGGHLKFDFALYRDSKLLCLIEYDGEQHFIPKERFGGENDYEILHQNDQCKNQYCREHNISLIRIPYTCKYIKLDMLLPETSQFLQL